MKKFIKKISILLLSLLTVSTFGVAMASCVPSKPNTNNSSSNTDSSGGEVDNTSYIYRVTVENQTGYGLKGVKVSLKKSGEEVASMSTNSNGNANFNGVDADVYEIEVTAPKGYDFAEKKSYKTTAQTGTQIIIPLAPQGVIMEEAPQNHSYKLGDVMYDFSMQTSDGKTFTLSEELKKKEMVMLNFWATWCGPCQSEFPAMNSAAIAYSDKVSVLAVSTTDSKDAVAEYKKTSGLTFNMANDSIGIQYKFNVGAIPHTIIIDRFGVIVFNHVGSMTAMSDFTARFDLFSGGAYQSTVVPGDGEDTIDPDQPVVEIMKPNVPAPSIADVKAAMGGKSDFTYSWDDEDEYSWPWLVGEDEEKGKHLYTPTSNIHSSYATLIVDFEAKANTALQFDYFINSEPNADMLYVMLDGAYVHSISGAFVNEWQTCTVFVFDETLVGKHQLTLLFYKDVDTSAGEDIVKINNLRFVNKSALGSETDDINIFRSASWGLNAPGASTQYQNYADVVLSETDGYYHVGSKTGPILFASVFGKASNWNTYALWDLAYSNRIVIDGFNYSSDVEVYAWEANNNMYNHGYTPVTQELKELLDIIVSADIYGEKYDCDYHENEWLELCSYYDHYGKGEMIEDPMKGITFNAAIPLKEGSNAINVPFAMNPRGFKYKFTPSKAGVYKFYSTGDVDTAAFFVTTPSRPTDNVDFPYYDDLVGAETHIDENGVEVADGNFSFYQYLEAGKTYYVLCTTFLDQPAQYNMEVKYIAAQFKYLDNTATGPHSFNEITGENYLPNAMPYEYADPAKTYSYSETGKTAAGDGYYRIKNADGSLGSIIYLDVNRPTAMFNSVSLYDVVRDAEKNYPDPTKRAFYINGKDYTPDIKKLCFKATSSTGELNGFVAVDKDVFELISVITNAYGMEGVDNDWLRLCYYYKYLGY